jgi:hypothetical protein
MAGATTLVLSACGSGSDPGETNRSSAPPAPLLLVTGQPTTAVVQRPDGARRRLDSPALTAALAPVEPLAAFKTVDDAGDNYGFDPPAYIVAFDGVAGRVTLVLGRPTFDGEGVYARRCGDPAVHLVTRTFFAMVERIATDGRPDTGPALGC